MKRFHTLLFLASLGAALTLAACGKSGETPKENAETTAAKADTAWICPMRCEGDKTYATQVNCPECGMALADAAATRTVYFCPMKCEGEKTYEKAGTCPTCEMNLVDKKVRPS
jgi:Cu2+-exporting ATPase